jgi:hypothetical protein
MLDWLGFSLLFVGLPLLGIIWLVFVLPKAMAALRSLQEARLAAPEVSRRAGQAVEQERRPSGDDVDARRRYMSERLAGEQRVKDSVAQEFDEAKRRVVKILGEHQQQDLESLAASERPQRLNVPRWPEDLE